MILLISQDNDQSTNQIMDWLYYYKGNFMRINGEDVYNLGEIKININNNNTSFSLKKVDFPKQFNVGWYRRWSSKGDHRIIRDSVAETAYSLPIIQVSAFDESEIRNFFFKNIKVIKWVVSPNEAHVNKILVLQSAQKLGINIPNSIVCTTKSELLNFVGKYKSIITKDISIPYTFLKGNNPAVSKTLLVNDIFLKKIPNAFSPSLFQKMIEKDYEVRSFYFDRKFYSMAIFSQLDEKTKLDFRNYNEKKPNRYVPYKLPQDIETKLIKLMDSQSLFSGSIDLIKEKNGGYVFLEINPVGQFGMTSIPCNYKLEKIIAQYLISKDEEEENKITRRNFKTFTSNF